MSTNQPDTATVSVELPVGRDAFDTFAVRTTAYASWLWVAVISTLIADVVLTVYGVRLGLTELNPVAADVIARVGLFPALALLKGGAVGVGIGGWVVMPADYRGLVPAGLMLPWTVAVVLNVITIGTVIS